MSCIFQKKFMRVCFPAMLLIFIAASAFAQKTLPGIHAHNDYLNTRPFYDAYHHGVGSIEADVFLQRSALLVAHTRQELDAARTLEALYLTPLSNMLRQHHGMVYPDAGKRLIF